MIIFVLAFLGGVLTILSPCILPVLPFVFARTDQRFLRSGLPLLLGMAVTFAAFASIATIGGSWAVQANHYGRGAALVLLTLFGLTLIFESLAERLSRPFVRLGNRLSSASNDGESTGGIGASLLLGGATGLLWAPCAGPILGLILTGAAISGGSAQSTLLLLAYAAGAATSLGAALLIGGRLFAAMKKSLGIGEWLRRGLGIAVLIGVVAIAFGLDTGILARLSLAQTSGLEQHLIDGTLHASEASSYSSAHDELDDEGPMPSFVGGIDWINSPPLTPQELRGKVVLVDFWTYSCINCIRSLPYTRAWAAKYRAAGLVVIGVHSPEFAFEKDPANVRGAVKDMGIDYPVVLDNDLKIWQAYKNEYWPAEYLIDASGHIRHHHFGEGNYANTERLLQQLLRAAGTAQVPDGVVDPNASGAQAASDPRQVASPETYVNYGRGERFASGSVTRDAAMTYRLPASLETNQWALSGSWTIGAEKTVLTAAPGQLVFKFRARDLNLVLGPAAGNVPVHFRITVDGHAPAAAHGVDSNEAGDGVVTQERLYQLVRQTGDIDEHTFEIEFTNPGVEVFAFTFG